MVSAVAEAAPRLTATRPVFRAEVVGATQRGVARYAVEGFVIQSAKDARGAVIRRSQWSTMATWRPAFAAVYRAHGTTRRLSCLARWLP